MSGAFKSWCRCSGNQIKPLGFIRPTWHWALGCFISALPWKVCRVRLVLEECLALPGAVGTAGKFTCLGCFLAGKVLPSGHKKRSKMPKTQTFWFSVPYYHSLQILTSRINVNQLSVFRCWFLFIFYWKIQGICFLCDENSLCFILGAHKSFETGYIHPRKHYLFTPGASLVCPC